MKIGAVYPQIELGGDPAALDRIGRSVEEIGFDHLLMYDHLLGASHLDRQPPLVGPYTENDPFHDPLVSFAYLAAITKRIELVTGVIILPQRQTVLVARQAADVDLISGGRLCMGVGTGWNYVEYQGLGQDFETRGARLSEQIELLRLLWREPLVNFKGRFDTVERAALNPRPKEPIPICCGGMSGPALKRAARLADGFIFAGKVENTLAHWVRLREYLAAAGRSETGFRAHYILQSETYGGLDLDAGRAALDQWQAAGGTHVSIVTMGLGLRSIDEHIDYFARSWDRAAGRYR
jgi:probable F420-dependent oxidoreductase